MAPTIPAIIPIISLVDKLLELLLSGDEFEQVKVK